MKALFVPFRETWQNEEQRQTILNSASSRYRCDWVSKYWPRATVWKKFEADERVHEASDIYIFQKTLLPSFIEDMERLHAMGKTIIFDLCDAEWDGHEDLLRRALVSVDYCTTSTEYIRQHLVKTYRKKTQLIVDRMDLDEFPKVKDHKDSTLPRVVWFGNRNTIHALSLMHEALYEAYRQIPFTLVLISDQFDAYQQPTGMEIPTEKIIWTLEGANDAILSGDVVVNPHNLDSEKGRAKSDNKTITSWALGMPVVSHGSQHRMASLLVTYLRSRALRSSVGIVGRSMVRQLYDVRLSALEFEHAAKEAVWIKQVN